MHFLNSNLKLKLKAWQGPMNGFLWVKICCSFLKRSASQANSILFVNLIMKNISKNTCINLKKIKLTYVVWFRRAGTYSFLFWASDLILIFISRKVVEPRYTRKIKNKSLPLTSRVKVTVLTKIYYRNRMVSVKQELGRSKMNGIFDVYGFEYSFSRFR
jgi:hypothetical protein